jgi:hypothetical protein
MIKKGGEKLMAGDIESTPNEIAEVSKSGSTAQIQPETIPEIVINPEFKSLIPPLDQGARDELKKSLQEEGCRDKLIVCKLDGQCILLDGHNRYEICKELRIPYKTTEIKVANRTEAKIWMIKNQRGRRNLNESQRAMLAVTLDALYSEQAKERMGTRTDLGLNFDQGLLGRSAEKAAKDMDVSHQTVSFAKRVVKEGIPELKEMVESGDIAVSAAAKVASCSHEIQGKIVESARTRIKEGKRPKIAALAREIASKVPKIGADALLEKFRKNQEANLVLLEGIEITNRPENLAELLSVVEKITTRLKEVETKSLDPKVKSQACCVIELKHFRTFIESIVPVSEEAVLRFESDGVRVQAADLSANMMLEAFLPRVHFSRYAEFGVIGLPDTDKLLGQLSFLSRSKSAGKKNLLIYLESGKGDKDHCKLIGLSGLNEIQCVLQNPSLIKDMKLPETVTTCQVHLDGYDLVKALKQTSVSSNTGKFLVSEKFFRISSEDETFGEVLAKGIAKPRCKVVWEGSANSIFAIDQLMAIKRTIEKCRNATLSLGMNQPLILDLAIDEMAIKYYVKEKEAKNAEIQRPKVG